MTRILVLYHSCYGHVEQMAYAQAEGARRVSDADVIVKRIRRQLDHRRRSRSTHAERARARHVQVPG